MFQHLFSPDYKDQPYWWDTTPRPTAISTPLPAKADVVVIGSGYTGLSAAIQTSRGGRETVVVDAKPVGWGCSSRNGGQVSTSIKPSYSELTTRFGKEGALAILREGMNALQWVKAFSEQEAIDCDLEQVGRFAGAHSARQFRKQQKELSLLPHELADDSYPVSESEVRQEIGTGCYHGGIVSTKHASLDPAKYHQGLYEKAVTSGVTVKSGCEVTGLHRHKSGYDVQTSEGMITAAQVIIATGGYTGKITPWHRRRIIPIGSYIIATDEIDASLMDKLMPKNRVITDTRKLVVYYRSSPDRKRIIFGGRVSVGETEVRKCAPRLHRLMTAIFPELKHIKVTHCWMGFVGYTFDSLPHLGNHDGLYYSMGYCGSGISLSSYLGMRIGQQVLGLPEGRTALDQAPFPTQLLYTGKPWFLAPSISYFKMKDHLS